MKLVLVLIAGALCGACRSAGETPGVPLYPNAQTRRPRAEIAQVAGPIAKIDNQDVRDQGGVFDLLPGCHFVQLDTRLAADPYALSGGVYWSGQFPATLYALRMKPGARYVIRRELQSDSSGHGRVFLSAREEDPTGTATDLSPAESENDLRACKDWESRR